MVPSLGTSFRRYITYIKDFCFFVHGRYSNKLLLSPPIHIVQRHIDTFPSWRIFGRVKLNQKRPVHVYFTRKPCYHNRITINKFTIHWSDHTKYLGVVLDKTPFLNKHIPSLKYTKLLNLFILPIIIALFLSKIKF